MGIFECDGRVQTFIRKCFGLHENKKLNIALSLLPSESNKLISKATKAGLHKEKILKDVTNKVVGELKGKGILCGFCNSSQEICT